MNLMKEMGMKNILISLSLSEQATMLPLSILTFIFVIPISKSYLKHLSNTMYFLPSTAALSIAKFYFAVSILFVESYML